MKDIIKVLELINKSLIGDLSLDKLCQEWPRALEDDKFYETIYNDIESTVEHYPSKVIGIFGKEDPIEHFKKSYEYNTLLTDQKLIKLIITDNPDSANLLEIRNKLLE